MTTLTTKLRSAAVAILSAAEVPPRRTALPDTLAHQLALDLLTAALGLEAERVGALGRVKLAPLYNQFDRMSPTVARVWLGPHLRPGTQQPADTTDPDDLWRLACGIVAEALDVADCISYRSKELPPEDLRAPVYRRFAATSCAIWDLARARLLCYACQRWTETEGMDPGRKAMGRINCTHCGTVVQL